jgi:hypothetical protein
LNKISILFKEEKEMKKKWIVSGIIILLFMLTILFTFSTQSPAAQVTLAWDANTEPDLAGYKLYYGTSSGNYSNHIDVGNVTSYTMTLGPGIIYHFAVTAYNSTLESSFSNEIGFAPGGYILWTNSNGQAKVQELDLAYTVINTYTYGSFSGWSPLSFTRDKFGLSYILWKNPSNVADLWIMKDMSGYSDYRSYGPFNGWSPVGFHIGEANDYLHWRSISGQENIWVMDDLSGFSSYHLYGPLSDWSMLSISVTDKGYEFWRNSNGQANLWIMNNLNTWSDYRLYGPFSGWNPISFQMSSDNIGYLLWKSPTNQANLWIMNTINTWSDYRLFTLTGFYPIGYFKY